MESAVVRTAGVSSTWLPLGLETGPARGKAPTQPTRAGAGLEVLLRRGVCTAAEGMNGCLKGCHPDASRRNDGPGCTRCVRDDFVFVDGVTRGKASSPSLLGPMGR